jgi:hypothetical protein
MLQKELSELHASKRIVKIQCFKKNCQNSMLQKELSKFPASKKTVRIPCFKKKLSKFHASKKTVKIPCFKKNCQNSMLQKELSKFHASNFKLQDFRVFSWAFELNPTLSTSDSPGPNKTAIKSN